MTIDQLNDWVDAYIEELQIVRENLVNTFKDTSISLHERWYLLNKVMDVGIYKKVQGWAPTFYTIDDRKLGAKFCEQRYRTISIHELFERFELTAKEEDSLKEEILQKGITGFVYDW